MIAVFLKDLREMWAAPVTLIALAVVSCLVTALAAALPLPEPVLRIGVAPGPPSCLATESVAAAPQLAEAALEPAPAPPPPVAAPVPGAIAPVVATEEQGGDAPLDVVVVEPAPPEPPPLNCPFPQRDLLVHAIQDLSGARYQEVGALETAGVDVIDPRWVSNQAWDVMDSERLNVLFVWYPTVISQDQLASDLGQNWLYAYGAEAGGTWIAYTRARSTAHAAQIRFSVRQAQASATHLANARANANQFAAPSVGFADSFTELGSMFVGLRHADRIEAAWLAQPDGAQADLEKRIASYLRDDGQPLSAAQAEQVRSAFHRARDGLEQMSSKDLRRRFRAELEASRAPATAGEQAFPADFEIPYLTGLYIPGPANGGSELAPGEDPLLILAPFLMTERDGPPRSNSAWLIPGLILIISSAIAFMLAAGSTVREREHGTEHLLKAGRPWWRAAIGKALAPAASGFAVLLMLLITAQVFFGYQIKPGWPYAIACATLAMLAASFQGVAAGSLLRSQSAALAVSGAYLICLILFGNVLIPMDAANWPASWLSQVLPTRLLSQEWTDWMTWGVPLQLTLLLGLTLLFAASLGALLLGALARQRSV